MKWGTNIDGNAQEESPKIDLVMSLSGLDITGCPGRTVINALVELRLMETSLIPAYTSIFFTNMVISWTERKLIDRIHNQHYNPWKKYNTEDWNIEGAKSIYNSKFSKDCSESEKQLVCICQRNNVRHNDKFNEQKSVVWHITPSNNMYRIIRQIISQTKHLKRGNV